MRIKLKYLHAIITLIFVVMLQQNVLSALELRMQDKWLQHTRPVDTRISILAIDEESLLEIGQWPWDRRAYAQLIEYLTEGNTAVIGLDITFPLPSEDDDENEAFVNAVRDAGNVVLARYGVFDEYAQRGVIEALELYEPFPALKEAAAALGHLNTIPDSDSVVRKSLLRFAYNGEQIDSFSWVIASKYMERTGQRISQDDVPLDPFERFHIAYAGKPQQFEVIPFSMVLNGDVPADYFEDRIVLVGPYTVGMNDDYLTPLDSNQSMFGVEIHANIIQSVLEQHYKKELDWKWDAAILIAIALIAYWLCRLRSVIGSFAALAAMAAAILYASRWIYESGIILSSVYLIAMLFTFYIVSVAYNYVTELAERKRVTQVFGRYVAPEVVDQILKNGEEGLKLGGSRKELTVLFVDIRGFTTLSERVEPEEIVGILNEYLDLTANCIFQFGGTLDKFIGDATMAIYNAPLPLEDHAMQAVRSAWAMKMGSAELEKKLIARFGEGVKFGIGIHTGSAVVGNIGSKTRMDFTVIGDTVNTTARLESSAKPGQIIVSSAVYELVKDRVDAAFLGEIQVKGKEQKIAIYELEGIK